MLARERDKLDIFGTTCVDKDGKTKLAEHKYGVEYDRGGDALPLPCSNDRSEVNQTQTHGFPSRPCTGAPIVRVCPGQSSTNKDRGLMGQKCGRPPEYFNEIASRWLLGAKTRVLARDTN